MRFLMRLAIKESGFVDPRPPAVHPREETDYTLEQPTKQTGEQEEMPERSCFTIADALAIP